jgi:hypothetical protein
MQNKFLGAILAIAASTLLSGCLSMQGYVDPALPTVSKQDLKAPAKAEPVQVLYEFRTKGSANSTATNHTKNWVLDVARDSGLFSEVSATPVANQRRLLITIDNVPITKDSDAVAKGIGTGLTFGLVGSMVTDGYICEATFSAPGGEPVSFKFNHAIHSTIGNASGPAGLKPQKMDDAAKEVVNQLTWSILRDLSKSGRL